MGCFKDSSWAVRDAACSGELSLWYHFYINRFASCMSLENSLGACYGLGKLTVLNPGLIITYPSVWLERPRSRESSHVGISQGTGLHNVEVFSVCGMCSSRKSNYWIYTGSAMLSASAVWPFVCTLGRQYPFPNVFQVSWSLWCCGLPGLKSQCLYKMKNSVI